MVIAKQSETGNLSRLNSKGNAKLVGISGMRGIMMSCPAYLPWEILASIVLAESLVITHLVPFVTLGGSKDCKIIVGAAKQMHLRFSRNSKFLLEIGLPGNHEVLSPRTCTQHSHQVTVLPGQY